MPDSPAESWVPERATARRETHDSTGQHRPIVSFAPRGGRLNDVQRRAWEAYAGRWLVERADLGGGTADIEGGTAGDEAPGIDQPGDGGLSGAADIEGGTAGDEAPGIDQLALFGRIAPLVLEIGPGKGDATAAMAAARPEINLLAVEVYKPGIAQTFNHLARRDVTNVRVLRADAAEVLRSVVTPGSLAEVWLFFPDPWPKRKHLKRRIVTPDFAELVASRLQPGGSWWLATDWESYARQMLRVTSECPALVNPHADSGGWAPRPEFRPETRFERRGLAEQRPIFDLHLVRANPASRGSHDAP